MSQSCFSLGFLSQNSLWKLSTFRGYKSIYSGVYENPKSQLQPNRAFWQLDLATRMSRELTAWLDQKFCLVVLQLS